MLPILFLLFFSTIQAYEDCQTPSQQAGKCILINNCPHLFAQLFRNETDKEQVKKSHCGFQSGLFPKVCCPVEAINFYGESGAISHTQHSTKCGLHEPEGPSDPWLAMLEYKNGNGEQVYTCGGILINKKYVLTAAHCLKGQNFDNLKPVKVHLGKFNRDVSESLVVDVDGTTAHEDYNPDDPNQYNDIGLVRLKNKVSFKDGFARPICIPMNNKKSFVGKTLSVTGYEKHGDVAKKRDGVTTIWENTECHLVYNTTEVMLRDSQICAGGKKLHYRHSYRTDLGGFLMHVSKDNSYSAIGILSLEGTCCGRENYPKVYTRIGSYISWIISNLKV